MKPILDIHDLLKTSQIGWVDQFEKYMAQPPRSKQSSTTTTP